MTMIKDLNELRMQVEMHLHRDEYLILAKLALSANLLLSGQKIRYSRQPSSHRSTTNMVRSRVTSRCATPLGDPRGVPKRIRNLHLQSEITKFQLRKLCAHSAKVSHSSKVNHKSKLKSLLSFIACDGPRANPSDKDTMIDFDAMMEIQILDDSNPISDNNDFGYLSNSSENDDVSAPTEQSLYNLLDTPILTYNEKMTQIITDTAYNALPNNIDTVQDLDTHEINTQDCIENCFVGSTLDINMEEQFPNTQFSNTPSTSCIEYIPQMMAPNYNVVMINDIEYRMVPTTNSTQKQHDTINYQSATDFQLPDTHDNITALQSGHADYPSDAYFNSTDLQSLSSTLSPSSISSRSTSTDSPTSPSIFSQEAALPSTSTKPAKSPRKYKNPAKVRVDNNKACDRYRQRKKEADKALRDELESLEKRNNELKTQWTNLHKELDRLQTKIINEFITCNTITTVNNVNNIIL